MKPVEDHLSEIETATVWDRLRERMSEIHSRDLRTDPALLAEKLETRARNLRSRLQSDTPRGPVLSFLAFQKGTQRFGIPISQVLEVLSLDHVSPVPWTPDFVCGAIHWRGAIVALLDLVRLFGIAESGIADAHDALLSGSIDEIYSVPLSDLRPPPELPGDVSSEWLIGVHHETRLILDMDQILQDVRLTEWRSDNRQ